MKHFIDTEFLEGKQKDTKRKTLIDLVIILSITLAYLCFMDEGYNYVLSVIWAIYAIVFFTVRNKSKTPNTIDLISIGIVSEDDREYYAVSKDFNLKEAWNRHDLKINKQFPQGPEYNKVYWIRENVLRPIFEELVHEYNIRNYNEYEKLDIFFNFDYKTFKMLINKFGKTNKEIANDIKRFVGTEESISNWDEVKDKMNTQFYAYYCSYDWVVFCWLFGKMIDLPTGFPMYCNDIKQIMDEKVRNYDDHFMSGRENFETKLSYIKNKDNYPVNKNPHHALSDAKFDRDLYNFLNKI